MSSSLIMWCPSRCSVFMQLNCWHCLWCCNQVLRCLCRTYNHSHLNCLGGDEADMMWHFSQWAFNNCLVNYDDLTDDDDRDCSLPQINHDITLCTHRCIKNHTSMSNQPHAPACMCLGVDCSVIIIIRTSSSLAQLQTCLHFFILTVFSFSIVLRNVIIWLIIKLSLMLI